MNINNSNMWPGNTYRTKEGNPAWLLPVQRENFVRLLDGVDPHFSLFCRMMLYTGIQLKEALALKADDVRNGHVYVADRSIPISKPLEDEFQTIATVDVVFDYHRSTVNRRIKLLMLDAGIPDEICSPQTLRRTWLITAYKAEVNPVLLARWAGLAFDSLRSIADAVADLEGAPKEDAEIRKLWAHFELK
ncbi:site-specific integrase (plasmid) [Thalassospira sp. SM2505]